MRIKVGMYPCIESYVSEFRERKRSVFVQRVICMIFLSIEGKYDFFMHGGALCSKIRIR